jgi:hypothetical protein
MGTPAEPGEIYDPYALISDVKSWLESKGLHPEIPSGGLGRALGGAGSLLRAMGIAPLLSAEESYKRTLDKVWDDDQDT